MAKVGRRIIEIPIGSRFGRLVVVGQASNKSTEQTRWTCACDCGNGTTVGSYQLRKGLIKSCGCGKFSAEADLSPGAMASLELTTETKTCSRCREVRSLRQFAWLKRQHRGRLEAFRDSWCLPCRKNYKHTSPQKAKSAARQRARRLTDETFRNSCRVRARDYYQANRDKVLAKQKAKNGKKGDGTLSFAGLGYLNSRLKQKFGITLDDYKRMEKEQDFRCAICGCEDRTKTRRLAVDHDHQTDIVRALLCHHCNTGLGNFFDDPALLWKAIQYLAKHLKIRDVS